MYPVDPELSKPVNIGVDCKPPAVSQMEKLEMWKNKRSQPELEQAVRLRQCEYPGARVVLSTTTTRITAIIAWPWHMHGNLYRCHGHAYLLVHGV